MSFTYLQLKTAVQDYTENDETTFVNNVPLFIRLSEERILKNVQLNLFKKNVSGNTTSGNKYLALPSDYLTTFSLSLAGSNGDKFFLLKKDPSFIQEYTPDSTTTGSPKYYADYDVDNFILAPTPDASYTAELHYFYRPTSLTAGSDSGTTWLSENAELALLYGSLIEAYVFMKGEQDILNMYTQKFQEAIVGIKMFGEAKEPIEEYRAGRLIRDRQ
tara:strand:+ start:2141 stop:2791 length:651 start_codon:yes stop_codon:yes gene_type:complete